MSLTRSDRTITSRRTELGKCGGAPEFSAIFRRESIYVQMYAYKGLEDFQSPERDDRAPVKYCAGSVPTAGGFRESRRRSVMCGTFFLGKEGYTSVDGCT